MQTQLSFLSKIALEFRVDLEENRNSRMLVAYCELLDEQQVYENAYKFENT
jgi:hypothetical protein